MITEFGRRLLRRPHERRRYLLGIILAWAQFPSTMKWIIRTMRIIMIAGVGLALAGCCGPDDAACTQSQNDALAGMLSGGTAFTNGYNQGRPPAPLFTTCTKAGCITQ